MPGQNQSRSWIQAAVSSARRQSRQRTQDNSPDAARGTSGSGLEIGQRVDVLLGRRCVSTGNIHEVKEDGTFVVLCEETSRLLGPFLSRALRPARPRSSPARQPRPSSQRASRPSRTSRQRPASSASMQRRPLEQRARVAVPDRPSAAAIRNYANARSHIRRHVSGMIPDEHRHNMRDLHISLKTLVPNVAGRIVAAGEFHGLQICGPLTGLALRDMTSTELRGELRSIGEASNGNHQTLLQRLVETMIYRSFNLKATVDARNRRTIVLETVTASQPGEPERTGTAHGGGTESHHHVEPVHVHTRSHAANTRVATTLANLSDANWLDRSNPALSSDTQASPVKTRHTSSPSREAVGRQTQDDSSLSSTRSGSRRAPYYPPQARRSRHRGGSVGTSSRGASKDAFSGQPVKKSVMLEFDFSKNAKKFKVKETVKNLSKVRIYDLLFSYFDAHCSMLLVCNGHVDWLFVPQQRTSKGPPKREIAGAKAILQSSSYGKEARASTRFDVLKHVLLGHGVVFTVLE